MTSRAQRLEALGAGPFDLLIVGGGITGAGAARDAALRGLKVALVDKGDWAGGTSSRSSKLVHGGLRYLETFQLGLVHESTTERAVQLRLAPHLVRPLEFMMPVYGSHKHGLGFINLGLWLYDGLALFRVVRCHKRLNSKRTLSRQPNLRPEGLKGSLTYFDAATDDARLTLENVLDAEALGAVTVSHAEVVSFLREGDSVAGAVVRDVFTGDRTDVRAGLVLNTTGPFADETLSLAGADRPPLLRPTKGAHLVFRADRIPLSLAVAMIHPRDGRAMFAIPWGAHVYVGTTDIDYEGSLDHPHCGVEDRDLILEVANHYFPEAHLGPEDIVSTWCGLRPLVSSGDSASASRVSREHVLELGPNGLLTMTGGKLTTYRLMAKELVNRAVKVLRQGGKLEGKPPRCATRDRPLPGAVGIESEADLEGLRTRLEGETGLPPAIAQHLISTHGVLAENVLATAREPDDLKPMCPTEPVIWAALDYAVTHEHAATLEDFFARRTQLLLRDPEGAVRLAPAVAERMARLLGWDDARQAREVAAFTEEARAALACRASSPP